MYIEFCHVKMELKIFQIQNVVSQGTSPASHCVFLSPSVCVCVCVLEREIFVGGRRETLVSLAFCRGP